jgi:hypothetical protein
VVEQRLEHVRVGLGVVHRAVGVAVAGDEDAVGVLLDLRLGVLAEAHVVRVPGGFGRLGCSGHSMACPGRVRLVHDPRHRVVLEAAGLADERLKNLAAAVSSIIVPGIEAGST